MSDPKKLADAITVLGEAFRQKVTPAMLRAYHIGLSDLEDAAVSAAVSKAIRTCRWMPTVAELRELAGETPPADAAVEAWRKVEQAVHAVGAYRSVDFGPLANATIRSLGGWERLCGLSCEEFDKWARKDFTQAYAAYSRMGVGDEAGRPLAGLAQSGTVTSHDGTQRRIEAPDPVLVGVDKPTVPRLRERVTPRLEVKTP